MSQLGWSNAVLLIALIAGLTLAAGSEVLNKSVCQGDSIKLFNSSINIIPSDTVLHLYKNGDKYRSIAKFTIESHSIQQENVVMDLKKYLWIIDVHTLDQGSYILQYDFSNGSTTNITTDLSVWVAPATTCKPETKRIGDTLIATLPNNSCGNPMATAYWKECTDLLCVDSNIRKLQAGREAGTYYACTTGPALRCARSSDPSSDYCFVHKIEESSGDGKDDLNKWLIAIVSLEGVLLLTVIIFGSHGCYIHNKLRSTTENKSNENQESKKEQKQQKIEEQRRKREQQQQKESQRQTRKRKGQDDPQPSDEENATSQSGNPKRNSNDKDSPEEENIPLQDLSLQLDS